MLRRPSVVRPSFTISYKNISATKGPIKMISYQKHHWDGGKAATAFGPDRIKTLVSMATDSYHRSAFFHPILFILAGNDGMHGSSE